MSAKEDSEDILATQLQRYVEPWMEVLCCGYAPQLLVGYGCRVSAANAESAPKGPFDAVLLTPQAVLILLPTLPKLLRPGGLILLPTPCPELQGPAWQILSEPDAPFQVLRLDPQARADLVDLRRELAIFRDLAARLAARSSSLANDNALLAHSSRERNELGSLLCSLLSLDAPEPETVIVRGVRLHEEVIVRALHFRMHHGALAGRLTEDQWQCRDGSGLTTLERLRRWNRAEAQLLAV